MPPVVVALAARIAAVVAAQMGHMKEFYCLATDGWE
jgi:hypothetical protein